MTALLGTFGPAGPISLFVMKLLLLPPATEDVLNSTFPPAVVVAEVDEPRIVEFLIVLFVAPSIKRTVLVLAVAEAVVLESVSELPDAFSPSIVTLSEPFHR